MFQSRPSPGGFFVTNFSTDVLRWTYRLLSRVKKSEPFPHSLQELQKPVLMRCFLLFATVALSLGADAQTYVTIPNGSFENWMPAPGPTGSMDPTQWQTFNPGASNQVMPLISRSSDATDGNWSVVIRPFRGLCQAFGGCFHRMEFLAPDPLPDSDVVAPRRFSGMYKFAQDSSLLSVGLTVCFQGPLIATGCFEGYADFEPVPASVWTPFSVELDTSNAVGQITGYSFVVHMQTKDTSANPVTYLQLDALRLEYDTATTTIASPSRQQNHLAIAPNPASEQFTLSWTSPLPNPGMVLLQNITGQTLRQYPVQAGARSLKANVSGLPAGQYLVRIASKGFALQPARLVLHF